MKKINSIWYGSRILGCGLLLSVVVPLLLYAVEKVLGEGQVMVVLRKGFMGAGILILAGFGILLRIELKQDKYWNTYYMENSNRKIILPDGNCECQNCGCRKAGKNQAHCPVCRIRFQESRN